VSQPITATELERACALTAVALSERRRAGVHLISGEQRRFGLSAGRSVIHVPYPAPVPDWSLRTYTCGVALQCAPSKDRIAQYPLHRLAERELGALRQVEGATALGWVARRWPGLLSEARRALPDWNRLTRISPRTKFSAAQIPWHAPANVCRITRCSAHRR